MSHHSLHLPIIQNWSCHNCGECCTQHEIFITPEERKRIDSQNWGPESGIPAGQPIFRDSKTWGKATQTRLAHQPDGGCVFLQPDGLCRIHAKFGEQAKPLACQVYPYVFHPKGNGLTLSLRFSCPSVVRNLGKPVRDQSKDLRRFASQVVPANYRGCPPPQTSSHGALKWEDTLILNDQLDRAFADEDTPLILQVLRTLFWVGLLEEAKVKTLSGSQLRQVLNVLVEGAAIEYLQLPETRPVVSRLGMSQFQLLIGQYARKDTESNLDVSLRGRFRQLRNAIKLSSQRGNLPEINEHYRAIKTENILKASMKLPPEMESIFRRYLRVKIQGMHFFGKAYYDYPFTLGYAALILTLPATIWLAKWRALSAQKPSWSMEDLVAAMNDVDHQHGYSPALGSWHARQRVKNIWKMEDLQKLVSGLHHFDS